MLAVSTNKNNKFCIDYKKIKIWPDYLVEWKSYLLKVQSEHLIENTEGKLTLSQVRTSRILALIGFSYNRKFSDVKSQLKIEQHLVELDVFNMTIYSLCWSFPCKNSRSIISPFQL